MLTGGKPPALLGLCNLLVLIVIADRVVYTSRHCVVRGNEWKGENTGESALVTTLIAAIFMESATCKMFAWDARGDI